MADILGLHHVTAIASDPQRNVDFYAGVLGLRLIKLTVNYDDPATYHLYYGDGQGHPGTIMTFFPWPGGISANSPFSLAPALRTQSSRMTSLRNSRQCSRAAAPTQESSGIAAGTSWALMISRPPSPGYPKTTSAAESRHDIGCVPVRAMPRWVGSQVNASAWMPPGSGVPLRYVCRLLRCFGS